MQQAELKALFDSQAAGYDKQWEKTAAIRNALLYLTESIFTDLPEDARVLCVGAGTGVEIAHFAKRYPGWHFTAVEPSTGMVEVCRMRAREEGFADRCEVHEGYLDTLPDALPETGKFHAATCLLVSQFMLDQDARIAFFRGIAERLKTGGILISSDLSYDTTSPEYEKLLRVWFTMMSGAGLNPEALERMRLAYSRDVAVLPPARVAELLREAGFDTPTLFYQAGLIHGWFSTVV